jgi:ABC-type Fe3+/spermidine/putrescine transport system ATPase subunit
MESSAVMAVEFQNVSKHYRRRVAVTEFTLQVQPGERLVLLGPSGCGKTTVLRLLAGLVAPDSGVIEINSKVVAMDGRNLKGPEERGLGMVFQDLALWPHLTVSGNLEFELNLQLRQELLRLQRELGFTFIYVTHNLEEAFDIATRIVVIKDGRIERIEKVSEIRAHFQQLLHKTE